MYNRMYVTMSFFVDPLDPSGPIWGEEHADELKSHVEKTLRETANNINNSPDKKGIISPVEVSVLLVEA